MSLSDVIGLVAAILENGPKIGHPLLIFPAPRENVDQYVHPHLCTNFGTFVQRVTISPFFVANRPDYGENSVS